jgi:hypothetical protein
MNGVNPRIGHHKLDPVAGGDLQHTREESDPSIPIHEVKSMDCGRSWQLQKGRHFGVSGIIESGATPP